MSHTIEYDADAGILVCRLYGFMDDEAAHKFGREMSHATARLRSAGGPLLVLFDNRKGRVASPSAAKALGERFNSTKQPGDRTAIVLNDSLGKLQTKRYTTTDHEAFVSENAARTWLTAYANSGRTAEPGPRSLQRDQAET